MITVVLATGNHDVLDVVGSAVLLAVSVAVASAWGHGLIRVSLAARPAGPPRAAHSR